MDQGFCDLPHFHAAMPSDVSLVIALLSAPLCIVPNTLEQLFFVQFPPPPPLPLLLRLDPVAVVQFRCFQCVHSEEPIESTLLDYCDSLSHQFVGFFVEVCGFGGDLGAFAGAIRHAIFLRLGAGSGFPGRINASSSCASSAMCPYCLLVSSLTAASRACLMISLPPPLFRTIHVPAFVPAPSGRHSPCRSPGPESLRYPPGFAR